MSQVRTAVPPAVPSGAVHVAALVAALRGFDPCVAVADEWGRRLVPALVGGARVLAAGNGGSAAQAQHLTAELVGRYRDDRAPFSAISLHAETSSLTAIANDYGVDAVFARQMRAHARPGDVAVLMSTSGGSSNIVAAAHAARASGAEVWAMTGPAPNPLAAVADRVLAVDAPATATVQELHLVALHLVCASFDVALAELELVADPDGLDDPQLLDAGGLDLGSSAGLVRPGAGGSS